MHPTQEVRSCHHMPFGTQIRNEGVTFSLWAPGAEAVDLCLAGQKPVSMEAGADGFFVHRSRDAAAGSLYRYRINGGIEVPDPASRFQPQDVSGPSAVIDPLRYEWHDEGWRGRPWHEAVIYELHVGTFSPEGTFAGVMKRLDYLVSLGVTAVELMPVWDFPGGWNFGYDGVLPFAPESRYGGPEQLKELVDMAHAQGLMVLLDVVYNHFGPQGNYLHQYAPQFFTGRHHTPWGDAINYDGDGSRWVRSFFVHNALYWLEEFHMDGLRLDAVHAIYDDSTPHILEELAVAVREGPGSRRHVHLVLENEANQAHYLAHDTEGRPLEYSAQWNDDIHHALHAALTGESEGYYSDYAEDPAYYLARCLSEGFAYQGDPSFYRHGASRGESSRHLPPSAFVSFLQNHDQIGNRAFGERIAKLAGTDPLRAAVALYLLAPAPPLLFMGEEWGCTQPFFFFCDFEASLAESVRDGRKREFAHFPTFSDPEVHMEIPDPCAKETFERSVLDWQVAQREPHSGWLQFYRRLLSIRHAQITPLLLHIKPGEARAHAIGKLALSASWYLDDGARLTVVANLGPQAMPVNTPGGELLFAVPDQARPALAEGNLPAYATCWFLEV